MTTKSMDLFLPACIMRGLAISPADVGVILEDSTADSCGIAWAPATCEYPEADWEDCPRRVELAGPKGRAAPEAAQ